MIWGAGAYLGQPLSEFRVFPCHILGLPTENSDCSVLKAMHLGSLTVVLVFTREPFTLEPVKDLANRLRRFSEHWFEWHTGSELAVFIEVHDPMFQEWGDDLIVGRKFTVSPLVNINCD
jgi:hypothetical protein